MEEKISYEDFIISLEKHKLIVLGEIHGTREIPQTIIKIIKNLKKDLNFVFVEIPKDQQIYIEDFVKSENKKVLDSMPFFKSSNKDGRDSKENLDLIFYILKNTKAKILCIDPISGEDRELLLYEEIKRNFNPVGDLGIFITGNFHANKNKVIINGNELKPCAYYLNLWLKDQLVNVNILACEGSFYNLTLHEVIKKNLKSGIYRTNKEDFDFCYRLKKFTPCSFYEAK